MIRTIKKISIISTIFIAIAANAEKVPIPMPYSMLSKDNGGAKSARSAYRDGIGIYTSAAIGDEKYNNSGMNSLVFKYGDEAEGLKIKLVDHVNNVGTLEEKKMLLANFVPMVIPNITKIGDPCNDGNKSTGYDRYIDTVGTCQGSNWETITLNPAPTSFTNWNVKDNKYTSIGQFANLFFGIAQPNGIIEIDYNQTQTGQSGMSFYLAGKLGMTDYGNSCVYNIISNSQYIPILNERSVIVIDFDNRKFWFQTKRLYDQDFKGVKYNFLSVWGNDISMFIQDCTSSDTGSFTFNEVRRIVK